MLIKFFLAVVLSLSVSCFADSGGEQSKLLIDKNQQTPSATNTDQQTRSSKPDALIKKRDSQSTEDSNPGKKPSMIEYCRNFTC